MEPTLLWYIRNVLNVATKKLQNDTETTELLTAALNEMFLAYRMFCTKSTPDGRLVLPESLKLLPQYINCLLKSACFRVGVAHDARYSNARRFMTCSTKELLNVLYPFMFQVDAMDERVGKELDDGRVLMPPQLQLSAGKIFFEHAYVIVGQDEITCLVGSKCPLASSFRPGWEEDGQLGNIVRYIRASQKRFIPFRTILGADDTPEGAARRSYFYDTLIEDRVYHKPSYTEFLYSLHRGVLELKHRQVETALAHMHGI
jgi:hypothetical protein